MPPSTDPRIFFASERTLLAWLRTGIAIVGLGFVVSRFGLFLRILGAQSGGQVAIGPPFSHYIGLVLVALGALSMGVAAFQHAHYVARLPEEDDPRHYPRAWAFWFGVLLALASAALAAYLAVTPP